MQLNFFMKMQCENLYLIYIRSISMHNCHRHLLIWDVCSGGKRNTDKTVNEFDCRHSGIYVIDCTMVPFCRLQPQDSKAMGERLAPTMSQKRPLRKHWLPQRTLYRRYVVVLTQWYLPFITYKHFQKFFFSKERKAVKD